MHRVEKAAPWPAMQRFDYLVRTLELTPGEVAKAKANPPRKDGPHREAVATALRELEAWADVARSK